MKVAAVRQWVRGALWYVIPSLPLLFVCMLARRRALKPGFGLREMTSCNYPFPGTIIDQSSGWGLRWHDHRHVLSPPTLRGGFDGPTVGRHARFHDCVQDIWRPVTADPRPRSPHVQKNFKSRVSPPSDCRKFSVYRSPSKLITSREFFFWFFFLTQWLMGLHHLSVNSGSHVMAWSVLVKGG